MSGANATLSLPASVTGFICLSIQVYPSTTVDTSSRLAALRVEMAKPENAFDAYLIPSEDAHGVRCRCHPRVPRSGPIGILIGRMGFQSGYKYLPIGIVR